MKDPAHVGGPKGEVPEDEHRVRNLTTQWKMLIEEDYPDSNMLIARGGDVQETLEGMRRALWRHELGAVILCAKRPDEHSWCLQMLQNQYYIVHVDQAPTDGARGVLVATVGGLTRERV